MPLTVCLGILAILQMLTGMMVALPAGWIAAWHVWLGLGRMPHDPLLLYAIRGGAFVQGAIGVLLWMIAMDIRRYHPLVIATATIYLVSGPVFYFIGAVAGMPRFWCIFDGTSCFLVGGILLILSRRFSPG